MRIVGFTEHKFSSLSVRQQHKTASELLREVIEQKRPSELYRKIECWLKLPPLDFTCIEEISNRFHAHLQLAMVAWKEHHLLHIRHFDKPSHVPFLPIAIYLDRLRSAFNVGSILRTTEAFRLGSVYFSPQTPYIDNLQVQKGSMGTYLHVPCFRDHSLDLLPRPWIALETASPSKPLYSFDFPSVCTLILGNEEHGIAREILNCVDAIVEIPLVGIKNSLNVAAAFSIVAAKIRSKLA